MSQKHCVFDIHTYIFAIFVPNVYLYNMPEFFGNNYNNIGTTENPIYRPTLSGGASGNPGGFGTPSYICAGVSTSFKSSGWPYSYNDRTTRHCTVLYNFKKLYPNLPEIDLSTMLYYTSSLEQGTERNLMPVLSENREVGTYSNPTPWPPEFIGNPSILSGTNSNHLYQLQRITIYTTVEGIKNVDSVFDRDQAQHYFIVNDAGTFYFTRNTSSVFASNVTQMGFEADTLIYKIPDDWTPSASD